MRFLADENFPNSAVAALQALGYDVVAIAASLPGVPDLEVLKFASREGRVILTFDKDFGELARSVLLPITCGIILFRNPMPSPRNAGSYLAGVVNARSDWMGQFSVIEAHRIRMRPLPLV